MHKATTQRGQDMPREAAPQLYSNGRYASGGSLRQPGTAESFFTVFSGGPDLSPPEYCRQVFDADGTAKVPGPGRGFLGWMDSQRVVLPGCHTGVRRMLPRGNVLLGNRSVKQHSPRKLGRKAIGDGGLRHLARPLLSVSGLEPSHLQAKSAPPFLG